jgi:hypothetical protein
MGIFNFFKQKGIPEIVPIKREEDYHTHYIGKTKDGRQFFGYQTFVFPKGVHLKVENPIQTLIDGFVFGLIPNEEDQTLNLQPSSTISFQEPRDGEYYT